VHFRTLFLFFFWQVAEPLKEVRGTPGFCGTPVEKHCHRAFTGSQHCYQRWQGDWSRDQCVTVAQVRTGHSPLAAAYLHRIGHRDSAICQHCQGAEETVEHLVFQCPAHDQARRDTWPGDFYNRSAMPLELPGTDWGGDPFP